MSASARSSSTPTPRPHTPRARLGGSDDDGGADLATPHGSTARTHDERRTPAPTDVLYAEVAIDVPVPGAFTYRVPPALAERLLPGHLVHVPWRQRSRQGIVLELGRALPEGLAPRSVRAIEDLLDPEPLLDAPMLRLVRFIASYYRAPIGEACWLAVPPGLRRSGYRTFRLTGDGLARLAALEPTAAAERLLVRALGAVASCGDAGGLAGPELQQRCPGLTYQMLDDAVARGLLEAEYVLERPSVSSETVDWISRGPGVLRAGQGLGANQQAVLRVLRTAPPDGVSLEELRAVVGASVRGAIKGLEKRDLVVVEQREIYRDPMLAEPLRPVVDHPPTDAQRRALEHILGGEPAGQPGGYRGYLLHGVTGSGKTEVYVRVIRALRAQGLTALVLLPEIALTPQFCSIFRSHFGDDVAVLHSGLTPGERYDAWRRLRRGEVGIAIGARSALFAPLPKLGIIVVDEEHDASFKQSESPRYNARDMALVLGKICEARVVLGSATPSLESYQLATESRLVYLPMPARVGGRPMPTVDIIDMTREENRLDERELAVALRAAPPDEPADPARDDDAPPAPGDDAPREDEAPDEADDETTSGALVQKLISAPLHAALADTLARGEQAIVLLNRRGHATFVQCLYCGFAFYCPSCSVSLTYHKRAGLLRCHLCEHRQPLPPACPSCTHEDLGLLGVGTQRLSALLQGLFPKARIGRLDRDTGGGRRLRELLRRFREHQLDVLVGTQMVAKGHDVHNVTLVGVVLADLSLNFPDFRSGERTYQLLAQVAGRAGRGELPGRVLIQTLSSTHPALQAAAAHRYDLFASHELPVREDLLYPPFGFLVGVRFEATDPLQAERAAELFARTARKARRDGVIVLGPALAPLGRVRGRTRYQLLLKAPERAPLRSTLEATLACARPELEGRFKSVRLVIDIDPLDML